MKAKLPEVHSVNQLVEAKKYWGVSAAALNYRLHKLGVTSEWQYRTFRIQITERYRTIRASRTRARAFLDLGEGVSYGQLRLSARMLTLNSTEIFVAFDDVRLIGNGCSCGITVASFPRTADRTPTSENALPSRSGFTIFLAPQCVTATTRRGSNGGPSSIAYVARLPSRPTRQRRNPAHSKLRGRLVVLSTVCDGRWGTALAET